MSEEYVRKDVYEADQETIAGAINDLRDRIDDYKDISSRQTAFWGILIAVIAFLFAGMQIGIAIVLYMLSTPHP